jgi:serine/threonine protein kinase
MTREKTHRSAHAFPSADTLEQQSSGTVKSTGAAAPSLADACLDDDQIVSYREGNTTEAERFRIHQHLDECVVCRELVDAVIANDDLPPPSDDDVPTGVRAFATGTVLADRYRVERFIGRGGMGEVYEAFDGMLGTRVAIKTVLPTACDSPRAVRKLFDEVRNAQRVTHPTVCRINELHTHRGPGSGQLLHFLTMEFIDGERLRVFLQRERSQLSVGALRGIARQLLEGLKAAHGKGVVHLDFKSENVMVRRGRTPAEAVIMDFGLSRVLDSEARLRSSEQHHVAGTLLYMSPEQIECRPDVGAAADVYAFGVVLYEMLAGRLPFEGASLAAVLLKQLTERAAPPSRALPQLSPKVDAFVSRCLSPDLSERYANAEAALEAFEAIDDWERSPRSAPSLRRWALARRSLMVGLVSVAVAGAALQGWRTDSAEPRVEPVVALQPPSSPPSSEVQRLEPAAPEPRPSLEVPPPALAPPTQEHPAPPVARKKRVEPPASTPRRSSATPDPSPPAREAGHEPAAEARVPEGAESAQRARSPTPSRRPKLPGAPERFLEPLRPPAAAAPHPAQNVPL